MMRHLMFETNEENFIVQILPHLSQHQITDVIPFLETFDVIHYFHFYITAFYFCL